MNLLLFLLNLIFSEFDLMFHEADSNQDGKIDFDEFVAMMLPATLMQPEQQQHSGPNRPT